MNVLTLLRGCPGVGKSTFVKEHGLEDYTISTDALRLLLRNPQFALDEDGGLRQVVCDKLDKQVFDMAFNILETRMQNGDFLVFDAQNIDSRTLKSLHDLSKKYNYRVNVVDMMGNLDLETILNQNRNRDFGYKVIPDADVIRNFEKAKKTHIPAGLNVIKKKDFEKTMIWRSANEDAYAKIMVFGDIHGCYTALEQAIPNGELDVHTLYVFTGDLFDRGIENAEVFAFLMKNIQAPNLVLLKGNHELHLRSHLHGQNIRGFEAREVTIPAIYKAGYDRKDIERLVHKLQSVFAFSYHGQEYVCTHGGVFESQLNPVAKGKYALMTLSERELVFGIGKHEYDFDTAYEKEQEEKGTDPIIQFHGHRNYSRHDINAFQHVYNLEGGVHKGRYLRYVELTADGLTTHEVKNDKYSLLFAENALDADLSKMDGVQVLQILRASKHINEARINKEISAFNFTAEAFRNKVWNNFTITARGLFLNRKGEIIARGYPKFFNLGENEETTIESIVKKVQYPITQLSKENGFLGISSAYAYGASHKLMLTSKGGSEEYSKYFSDLFYAHFKKWSATTGRGVGELLEAYRKQITDRKVSLTFEVIDVENDKHITIYDESKLVLLHAIQNDFTNTYDRAFCDAMAEEFGFERPNIKVIQNEEELLSELEGAQGLSNAEGYVFEDANHYMFKVKAAEYRQFKYIRGCLQFFIKSPENFTEDFIREHTRYDDMTKAQLIRLANSDWSLPSVGEGRSLDMYQVIKKLQ